MAELNLEGLSDRAQRALRLALGKRPVTLPNLRTLGQRDIWIMPNFGRVTSNEIKAWAKEHHDFDMPERASD